jgi:NDP-sugar pyrophosphorylase family protein
MQIVILCGGKGTRSYPFTAYFPKPMMPVAGKPILVHIMHLYAQQGFTDFVLAAGHRQEILHDYFDGRFPEWKIRIVDTGQESDTGVSCAASRIWTIVSSRPTATGSVTSGSTTCSRSTRPRVAARP